jgi:DNA-directed RNA polymerase subunit RPC12/RpoP
MAQYVCLNCVHEWKGKPGPVKCPKCGHLYVKWLDYGKK